MRMPNVTFEGETHGEIVQKVRDYFPESTDLSIHSPQHLLAVENELNNRPRLILKGRSPAELFKALLASKNRPRCDVD